MNTPKVKVCFLLPSHWSAAKGGSEYRAHTLAEYLAAHTSFDVVYLTRKFELHDSSYELQSFRGPQVFGKAGFGMVPHAASLYRALKTISPDVVLQFVACAYTGVAAAYARRNHCSLFWFLSSDQDVSSSPNVGVTSPIRIVDRALFRYGVRHADCIFAQTHHQSDLLLQRFSRKATAVVPNFHRPFNGAVSKSPDFTVVWVGSIKKLKRPQLFVELARYLLANKNIRLEIIGRSESTQWGSRVVDSFKELDNVTYHGEMDLEDVNLAIEKAHVLVNTSEYEGLPNTFIQAWLREVPTLSLGVDPDYVISRHGLGYVLDGVESMAHSIVSLENDRPLLAEMGRSARKYSERQYSMKNANIIVEQILSRTKPKGSH